MEHFPTLDIDERLDQIHALLSEAAILWHDRKDFKPANELARQAESLIRAIDPPTSELRASLVESLTLRGDFSWVGGDFRDAFASVEEAIEICETDGLETQLVPLLLLRGSLLTYAGEDSQAVPHLVRCAALAKQYHRQEELFSVYMTLGAVLGGQANPVDALEHFQQGLTVAEAMNEPRLIAAALNNVAISYHQKGDPLQALDYGERARVMFQQLDRPAGLTSVHNTIGEVLVDLGRLDEANTHFQTSLENAVRLERPHRQLAPLGSIANLHFKRGNFEQALATTNEMLALAGEFNSPVYEKAAHELLANVYEAMGDDRMALTHFKKATTLQAAESKEQITHRVEKLMLIHRVELAHAEAAHQQAERALQDEIQRRQIFNDFIRDVSHDIRTPITVINTNLYLHGLYLDEEKRERSIATIKAKMKDLERILEDMFEMARLDSLIQLQLTPVDLNQVMEAVAHRIGPMATEKQQTLTLEPTAGLPKIKGDEVTLVRCLMILAENAVRYTDNLGNIVLRTRANGAMVWVEIQDSGRGIPSEDLHRVFNRFFRGDQARTTSGSGLGLAIAKRIVELHIGRLEVESEVGVGSIFRVFLRHVTER